MILEMHPKVANYRHYGTYLKKRFNGEKVFKLTVDGGFTCPNRDGSKGYGGCSYCNVDSFTPAFARKLPSLKEQILTGAKRLETMYGAKKYIIYFQPNTNTYASVEALKEIYDEALGVLPEQTVGLSVGTRVDCLDREKADLFEEYARSYYVSLEIGLESIYEQTLASINRKHSVEDFKKAMDFLQDRAFELCVHTIFGFPGETREMMLAVADFIGAYKIQFIKLHHLHIVEGSIMAKQYQRQPFPLFSLEEYVDFIAEFIPRIRSDIVLQRLFAVTDQEYLIAPKWQASRSEIHRYIEHYLIQHNIIQGSACDK